MKKFTDEELSRILSHAEDLEAFGCDRCGANSNQVGCVNQAAYNIATLGTALMANRDAANAFDSKSKSRGLTCIWPPVDLLRLLEKVGCA